MIFLRATATALLLTLTWPQSPALARSSFGGGDPPWNPEHVNRLPAEIRKAIGRLCGSLQAAHYFATYTENSRLLNLHFEHSHCEANKSLCTPTGCLHQVYALKHGHYRLERSYYRLGND